MTVSPGCAAAEASLIVLKTVSFPHPHWRVRGEYEEQVVEIACGSTKNVDARAFPNAAENSSNKTGVKTRRNRCAFRVAVPNINLKPSPGVRECQSKKLLRHRPEKARTSVRGDWQRLAH